MTKKWTFSLAPFVWDIVKEFSPIIIERAKAELEKILGMDIKSAEKTTADEILYNFVLLEGDFQNPDSPEKIREFRKDLLKKNKDWATAFVLYIAQVLAQFSFTEKTGETNYQKGLRVATKFLETLLSYESTDKRIEFLELQGVFTLIVPEESEIGKRIRKLATEIIPRLISKIREKLQEKLREVALLEEKIDRLAQKINELSRKIEENTPSGGVDAPSIIINIIEIIGGKK